MDAAWTAWREYNDSAVRYPDEGGLVAWIARAAQAHPDRIAVEAADGTLTYAELAARSDKIARALEKAGVTAGAIVAVAASRNAAPYIGILGALKAECGYLPIDPADPADRLRSILTESRPAALLATSEQLTHMGKVADGPLVRCVLDEPDDLTGAAAVKSARDPNRTCYVIYTSGTTGGPKGVCIAERSVLNFVHWMVSQHGVTARHRLAQVAPLTFDPSVQQIFSAWIAGACLVSVPEAELLDPRALARWLRRQRITHLDIVTAHWQNLREAIAQDPELSSLPDLRWIVIGGDDLYYEQVRQWHEVVDSPALLDNIYGPTEATINATWGVVDPTAGHGKLPIGIPLPNYRLYAVDGQDGLCEPGAVGELLIAGEGVAQRYQSAEATARAFRSLTLPDGTVERVYRTGDLARLIEAGRGRWTLEFRGRADSQIKLRGYRIEPAEVEAATRSCPGVRDAVVLVRPGPIEQLICFYTADDDVSSDAVRRFQNARLAAHQLPNLYLRLDSFPLTGNGKLDRSALLDGLSTALATRSAEGRPPTLGFEQVIAEAWTSELGIGAVGADEDFFSLGGTSLLAMRVVVRLRSQGVPVEPSDLFEHPCVAAMAKAADQR